jgi:hypothetical protein
MMGPNFQTMNRRKSGPFMKFTRAKRRTERFHKRRINVGSGVFLSKIDVGWLVRAKEIDDMCSDWVDVWRAGVDHCWLVLLGTIFSLLKASVKNGPRWLLLDFLNGFHMVSGVVGNSSNEM